MVCLVVGSGCCEVFMDVLSLSVEYELLPLKNKYVVSAAIK